MPMFLIRNKIRSDQCLYLSLIGMHNVYTCYMQIFSVQATVKPVLSGHSKKDKTKVLKTNGSLMKVERIAECSLGAFCNTFDLHEDIIGLETNVWSSF